MNAKLSREQVEALRGALLKHCGWGWTIESRGAKDAINQLCDMALGQAANEPIFYGDDETIADWNKGHRKGGAVDLRITSKPYPGTCVTPLYAHPAEGAEALPAVLFDGYAVLTELKPAERLYTSAENVSAVLDAVVRILRGHVGGNDG